MIVFVILKLTGVLGLSWWWILLGPVAALLPFGLVGAFIALKLTGSFAIEVSWWWIIIPVILDISKIAQYFDE